MPTPSDLRDAVEGLSTLAARDLRRLWRDVGDVQQAKDALADVLPSIVTTYGLASASLAADWYDELRDDLNIDGRFSAIVADLNLGADALVGYAVSPLFDTSPDFDKALALATGGLQLRVATAARETVRVSSIEDPRAQGWQRSASMGCAFCQMLAARGAVYSEATVSFAAHENCNCVAVPAFSGQPLPVKPYTPSERNITDADRARVRAYLREHHAG